MVPSGWRVTSLKEATVKIQDGNYGASYPKREELLPSGVPFLTSKVLGGEGKINASKYDYISFEKHVELKKAHITTDDILFTNRGANVGVVAIAGKDLADANIGPQLTLIRANEQTSDKTYLYFFMKSNYFLRQVRGQDSGSAMNFFGIKSTEKFKIILPPLPEQRKIAKILSTWDKAISTTERLIDNSKQQKKALMQQLLTGKKRLLDDSGKPFDGKWVEIIVGKAAELTAGATPSTKNSKYWGGNIPWMNSGEINLKQVFSVEGRITEIGLQKSSTKLIPENSILIALAGQGKTRGTVAINRVKLCTNQSIAAIMPNAKQLNSEFLYFNLDNRYRELRSMSTGDGGRGGLNLSILKSIKLHLPSLTEQQKIASVLTNADREIELLEQQLTDLKQEKKALMQQLLIGKRRVKLDDKEVA